MTMTVNSQDLAGGALGQLDDMIRELEGQELVSQSRCVDQLLDLMNISTSESVRDLVVEVLGDIRRLTCVRADEMAARYGLLGAGIELETPVD